MRASVGFYLDLLLLNLSVLQADKQKDIKDVKDTFYPFFVLTWFPHVYTKC